jgi:hypothetical protein
LRENDSDRSTQNRLIRRTISIYRELLASEVIERRAEPDPMGRQIILKVDLQADFALNQPLSSFALAALDLLDPTEPTHSLDVVSVIESTLEDPRPVLMAQRNAARGEAVAAMKAEGLDYDERMEALEDVTWPQPLAELLEAAYEIYRQGHPWIAEYPLAPKSVVREMSERAATFVEFVSAYGLARSEGSLLRYLADAYRALRQTVPDADKSEELTDLIEWLGELVRQTDSSLLDEWETLAAGKVGAPGRARFEAEPRPITGNIRAFTVLVRNALFRRVQLAARGRWEELGELDAAAGWDAEAWESAITEYVALHGAMATGPNARGPKHLVIDRAPEGRPGFWTVRQIFDDPAGDHDWGIRAEVDLDASDREAAAVILVHRVGPY